MGWYKRHLNLTFLFAWLVANYLFIQGELSMSGDGSLQAGWLALFVLGAIIILGTEVWYLLQKRRRLWFLFLNLLNWIGFIVLLTLENKAVSEIKEDIYGQEVS